MVVIGLFKDDPSVVLGLFWSRYRVVQSIFQISTINPGKKNRMKSWNSSQSTIFNLIDLYYIFFYIFIRFNCIFYPLFSLIFSVQAKSSSECGNETEELAKCQNIKFFTSSEDFTSERMTEICDDYSSAMRCIRNYTRTCMDNKKYQNFYRIMKGTTTTMNELCRVKGEYYQQFIRHSTCIQSIKMEHCSHKFHERAQVSNANRNVSLARVCCSLQDYMQCTQTAGLEVCGIETANFIGDFFKKMLSPLIKPHCDNLDNYHHEAECFTSSSHTIQISKLFILFVVIFNIVKSLHS